MDLYHKQIAPSAEIVQGFSRITIRKTPKLSLPLSPQQTLIQFKSLLTTFEQSEILKYKDIYYCGSSSIIKINTVKRPTGSDLSFYNINKCSVDHNIYNNGYDDARGDLYLTKNDHIAYRYEIIGSLGKGSFGQVCKCFDHKTKQMVAVKIIRNKQRFQKQGLVEIKILERITREDTLDSNLIHLRSHFSFRNHLCFVFELLGTNLYEWLKTGGFRGIHTSLITNFAKQILNSLILLKQLEIVHCDLKPENILLVDPNFTSPGRHDVKLGRWKIPSDFSPSDPRYKLKIIDFGSSCYQTERMYTYVQSRFYRSPEVILGCDYTTAIDVWSLGCILVELYTGYPLFPGENEQEQLWCIMEILGPPPTRLLDRSPRTKVFFDGYTPKPYANSRGKKRRVFGKTLSVAMGNPPATFVNFIEKLLAWDPMDRYSPQQAMEHPFITGRRLISSSSTGGLPPISQRPYTENRQFRWK